MKENKNKFKNKKKNNPIFILIGLMAMIVIVAIIYYMFLRYSPEKIITYSGYWVEGKSLSENLKNEDTSDVDTYLDLVEVNENDLLYKRLNSYYIGEDEKTEVDINYPIYINEGTTIWNINDTTSLITVNYEEVEGYPEFMLTGGIMYNGDDLTRADGNEYLFLKSEDAIYTNAKNIKILTTINEYEIGEYSYIYFAEEYITYYEIENAESTSDSTEITQSINLENAYLKYKKISDIDNNSEVEINGETITYKELLERLGIIANEENADESEEENTDELNENNIDSNDIEEQEENSESNNTEEEGTTSTEAKSEWQEGEWEKPEVSCTDFEAEVYTIKTNINVTDRAGVIQSIIFEIRLNGRLSRRVQVTQTGELEITGLQPETEYEITGIVYYSDENGQEVEETFYTGTVETKSIDTLGTIDFSFENGEIYSNKIEIIHLKINNSISEEVVKGISRIQVEINGVSYRLSNNEVNSIKAGEEITYQTSETVSSNSTIKYEIKVYDKYGNELKVINNEGETVTSKQEPTVSIKVTTQEVIEVDIEVTLTNKDNVEIDNYRYEIIDQSGNVVKEGMLNDGKSIDKSSETETLIFTDLDPNEYYQMVIYGDYDLGDGKGTQESQELGRGTFVTRPLESLGYIGITIEETEVLQEEMTIGISIDESQTDTRLITILEKVEVVIYDQGKNVDDNDTEETEIARIILTEEEIKALKTSEEVELNIDRLTSNTKYRIDVITTVKQGTVETEIENRQNMEEIITLKMPAEVQIRNQFVIGTMIDLDIRVEDIDNAVLTGSVRIEVRDEDNKLISLEEMTTNEDYERKTYEDLEENETYKIIVYAPQYNEGSTDATYYADYILLEIEIKTEAGISGSLGLLSLEQTATGKNLINVASKVNWYERCFNHSYAYGINYDEDTKILTLGGAEVNHADYYDLSKYIGQEVTISFKAKTDDTTNLIIVEKTSEDFTNEAYMSYYTISDLNSEWQEYTFTVTLNYTGYIGFYVMTNYAEVQFQELQIELGNTKTSYKEFTYTLNANVNISVYDQREEITTNDYYIRIYKNDEQVAEYRYEELGEEHKVENELKSYEVEADATYKIELLVKVQDRYYDLASQEFTTTDSKEIKGISSANDFLKIQPKGEYIVLSDIDLSGLGVYYRWYGGTLRPFEGKIDFNGKTLTMDNSETGDALFSTINGTIENIVLNIKINSEIERNFYGLAYTNYGIIKNIQVNLIQCNELLYNNVYLVGYDNYGTVENFVVNSQKNLHTYVGSSLFYYRNYGTIKNGYIYGENMIATSQDSNSIAGLVRNNTGNGIIENVFSLVNVDSLEGNNQKANLVYSNYDNATIQNVYSVGVGENTTDLSIGPNVYSKYSTKINNNYYFTDEIFTSNLETKGNKLSLWDAEFQNQLINSDGAFIVDDLVNEGYYPQLNMSDVMPAQEYIELPEVEDADLPDILSTKVLEQGTDTVTVQFSVNNPSAETISDITIENLETEIISQEYSSGKSTVIATLKNPVICVSSYDVLSITTTGAFSTTYTRNYDSGERVINVDLYNEIWSVQDWKNIANSNTENYMLMTDLDFINEGNTIQLSTVNGIINGNGHTISNINLTGGYNFISSLYGTLENLYIENFNQESATYGGLIYYAGSNSVIDNVHLSNVKITKAGSGYTGGLVRHAASTIIKNCSVNNIEINIILSETASELYIGGLAGYMSNSSIQNCYVYDININDVTAVSSAIGGIVGYGINTNSIINCYSEGNITSSNINVGGIVGCIAEANIENCYSKVNITTTNNYVGGIVGIYTGEEIINISNNLSIGNIYTTSGIDALNRIVGSSEETVSNNYAYENQLLNGYVSSDTKGATLLSADKVLSLDLGDSYDYSSSSDGILPKLYNTDGTEILPNQEDIYLVEEQDVRFRNRQNRGN